MWRATKGSMDRAHDIMTVICDAPLIWWPRTGVCGMDLKTCVLSVWLTTLCALWIALAEWNGPVLCKHMVWRHRKILKHLKQILAYSRHRYLLDSNREGTWKLLFLIFCRFHVNNGHITIVMRHACKRAWSIYTHGSETGPSPILKLKFPNTNFKIFLPMVYDTPVRHLRMKHETAKI